MTLQHQPNSYVTLKPNGEVSSYIGPDAVALAAAIVLKHALLGYAKFRILPTRGITAATMLQHATRLTGKPYRRGQHAAAAADVNIWCEAMKPAIPLVQTP